MKLPDVNLWLALSISGHAHHRAAKDWFEAQATPSSIAFCRTTQQGWLRLITLADLVQRYQLPPLTNQNAWKALDAFMEDERIAFCQEPEELESQWRVFAARNVASSKLWMDAYLAAFAVTGGMQIVTFDKGFSPFAGLDLELLTV